MEKKLENEMETGGYLEVVCVVFYLGILWYPIQSQILSSSWGIVFCIRNIILLGLTAKTHYTFCGPL